MTNQLLLIKAAVLGWFHKSGEEERGASLVEYALLLALIAVVAIGALFFLGNSVNNTLTNVGQNIAK